MNTLQIAEQFRKAVQMFAASLSDEKALEIATIYDPWKADRLYKGGDLFTYGVNSVGDPQLYRVNAGMDHVSQLDWLPDLTPSLYSKIGLDESGHPVWSRPTGSHDAYNTGDIVNFNGTLFESLIDGNVYSPVEYPAGWREVTE